MGKRIVKNPINGACMTCKVLLPEGTGKAREEVKGFWVLYCLDHIKKK